MENTSNSHLLHHSQSHFVSGLTNISPVISSSAFLAFIALLLCAKWLRPEPFQLINAKRFGEVTNVRAKKDFVQGARQLLAKGRALCPDKPFKIMGDVGEIFILPPKYAYEIRNHDHLSFTMAAYKAFITRLWMMYLQMIANTEMQWFYAHLPGFEGFREGTTESQIMKLVARHQLTHQLTLVTGAVSEECGLVLQSIYTDNQDWHEIPALASNLQLMARISSRVFLGEEMCRNPQWLRITSTYTVIAFRAVEELRLWPAWLRPLVQWYLPRCTEARALVQEAKDLVNPLLKRRRAEKARAEETGESVVYNDAIEWLDELAQGKKLDYEPACAQLSLSVAAIHSTTDFFTQVMFDIAQNPELIEPMREEIIAVLGQQGWSKKSLYDLKLVDSVMKESQRLKPIAIASMRRFATDNVKLSDGTVLPKNNLTLVSAHQHWDPDFYKDPEKFDGYRFFNMRKEPGKENKAQLVSATPDHMGFGYGVHACPGRFFASEEIKIALSHILLKYDLKPAEGSKMEPRKYGLNMNANPTAKLSIRRRKEEIVI